MYEQQPTWFVVGHEVTVMPIGSDMQAVFSAEIWAALRFEYV